MVRSRPSVRITLATALAVLGTAAVAVPSSAAPTAAPAGDTTMTTAERCDSERVDVRRARRALARARNATEDRVAKVARAKKRLERQKRQRARWCSAARREAEAATLADDLAAAWAALGASAQVGSLPDEVRIPMVATTDEVVALTGSLVDERIPGADPAELAAVVDLLTGLAPSELSNGVTAFALKLSSATSDPDALAALVAALVGPGAPAVPGSGGAAQLQDALEEVLAALEAFDPDGGSVALSRLVIAVKRATEKVQSSGTGFEELFMAYGGAAGGSAPHDPAVWTQLFAAVLTGGQLPFPLPKDLAGLASLDALLGALTTVLGDDVPLTGAESLVGDLIDDLVDGGLTEEDLSDVVDPGGLIGAVIGGVLP